MAKRIGVVTIGATPRPDGLVTEIGQILGGGYELLEAGALDGLSKAEVQAMAPEPGEYLLITVLGDGSSVTVAKRHIVPLVQKRIDEMNAREMDVVLLMCTGAFPPLESRKPLVRPQPILYNLVRGIAEGRKVGVMTPLPAQVEQARSKWSEVGVETSVAPADPYGDPARIEAAALELARENVSLIVMDCFGYTLAMKELVRRETGLPVVLARSAIARVVGELT